METNQEYNNIPTLYFPNGKPVPPVLTPEELVHLLRLDVDGPKSPEGTLEYYREKKKLRGIKIGQHMRYYLPDVIKFLEHQADWTNRNKKSPDFPTSQQSKAAVK